jgi:chromosomal replication initiation ATPase DnaA
MTQEEQFAALVGIVAQEYGVEERLVLSKVRTQAFTVPRNIVAAIWSNANTLQDTATRIGWGSPQHVIYARKRVERLYATRPAHEWRMDSIVNQVQEVMPWLVAAMPDRD